MANLWKLSLPLFFIACSAGEAPPATEAPPLNVPTVPPSPNRPPEASTPKPAPPAMDPFEVWRRREPIYELYVRHFSEKGNFEGVKEKLPELRALGIGIVWLLPVN